MLRRGGQGRGLAGSCSLGAFAITADDMSACGVVLLRELGKNRALEKVGDSVSNVCDSGYGEGKEPVKLVEEVSDRLLADPTLEFLFESGLV